LLLNKRIFSTMSRRRIGWPLLGAVIVASPIVYYVYRVHFVNPYPPHVHRPLARATLLRNERRSLTEAVENYDAALEAAHTIRPTMDVTDAPYTGILVEVGDLLASMQRANAARAYFHRAFVLTLARLDQRLWLPRVDDSNRALDDLVPEERQQFIEATANQPSSSLITPPTDAISHLETFDKPGHLSPMIANMAQAIGDTTRAKHADTRLHLGRAVGIAVKLGDMLVQLKQFNDADMLFAWSINALMAASVHGNRLDISGTRRDLAPCVDRLAESLYRQGRYTEARATYHGLLAIIDADAEPCRAAMAMNQLAACSANLNDFNGAKNWFVLFYAM
jgi:tetratricopeptide (TPR) repeat protein